MSDEKEGIIIEGLLSQVRSDGRTGSWKLAFDIPADQTIHMMAAMTLYLKRVRLSVIEITEE